MTMERISSWVKANRWLVAFGLVVIAGYTVGKDRALRDNDRDMTMAEGR